MTNLYFPLLIATLFATSCVSDSSGVVSPKQQAFACPAYPVSAQPVVFESSFFEGAVVQQDSLQLTISRTYLGSLPVVSGRIIATDPVSMGTEPFTTVFPKGRFPVELAVAHFNNDERVAFARILFSAKPVVKWQIALLAGQKPLPINGKDYYGYPVDAGVGLFADANQIRGFNHYLNADEKNFEKVFLTGYQLDSSAPLPGLFYAANGDTVATFSTGWGDGSYATYIGFDAKNQPCRLLTDFQVISW
ncbi:DUF4241 domain-containing protein [Hymenobacter lutimineralis]|uniref:DUF4241 domain-containing protein n=1 Tax=Hymenobacter lutimineralis TaxID=2606448 RepID=A0A5D6UY41_9BACT|nr:DUF4241 domain-containing protein [Hymenobacter lutimineralis]TYZ08416.1 DUF4241 domain-containing protein [Hymenobacter lutimineralis]